MFQPAPAHNVVAAVFNSHLQAEECVERLRLAGFDQAKLSLAARSASVDDDLAQKFWDVIRESLPGWAVITLPRIGTVVVAGPLGGWIMAAVRNQVLFGGFSALGASLYALGIPKGAVERCESAVEAGNFLVIAHGAAGELGTARELLAAWALKME